MAFNFSPTNLLTIEHLRFKRLWLSIGVLLVVAVVIASVVRQPDFISEISYSDKLVHFIVYACLMGWFAQIFRHDLTRFLFVVLLAGLGGGIEFLQAATPTRNFDSGDMVANACGVLLAWALAYTWVGNILPRVETMFIGQAESKT